MGHKLLESFLVPLKLGLTSFGGPIAHLGYFHNEYIMKRKWLDEKSYTDLVALCQFLPGPASSQLGIAIGTIRAGLPGGIAAWLGFTLPSAFVMIIFAMVLSNYNISGTGWLHGLKIVAVGIVAQAVITMWKNLVKDKTRAVFAVLSMIIMLFWKAAFSQIVIIVVAGIAGLIFFGNEENSKQSEVKVSISRKTAIFCLILFFTLLAGLPLLRFISDSRAIAISDSFYRTGSLVFGGGHVVLPLLEKEVVFPGWINHESFLAGYGAAQAIPGPLFTFAGYLGQMMGGVGTAILALVSIFLPGYLLIIGTLPFWNSLRNNRNIQGLLAGINSAVIGLLLAALYNPIWTSSILSTGDFALAAVLFCVLVFWNFPSWSIVLIGAAGGTILGILRI